MSARGGEACVSASPTPARMTGGVKIRPSIDDMDVDSAAGPAPGRAHAWPVCSLRTRRMSGGELERSPAGSVAPNAPAPNPPPAPPTTPAAAGLSAGLAAHRSRTSPSS